MNSIFTNDIRTELSSTSFADLAKIAFPCNIRGLIELLGDPDPDINSKAAAALELI